MDVGSVMQLGLVNALRTGYMPVDSLLCVTVPLMVPLAIRSASRFWEKLSESSAENVAFSAGETPVENESWLMSLWHLVWPRRKRVFLRTIEAKYTENSWGSQASSETDRQNALLQKAIYAYLDKCVKQTYSQAQLELTELGAEEKLKRKTEWKVEQYEVDSNGHEEDVSNVHEYFDYGIVTCPAPGIDVHIGDTMTVTRRSHHSEHSNNERTMERSHSSNLNIRSTKDTAELDKFVRVAWEWYIQDLAAARKNDRTRYLYVPVKRNSAASTDDDNNQKSAREIRYKRYALSEEKTFDTIFIPNKEGLLRSLNDFLQRKGKFSISGFPNKLGLLLHGPPGTGKTSLIKAIATFTKRSTVNIPLSRIKTNGELMEIMFDQKLSVIGEDIEIRLQHEKVIFVIEDIDAATSIVHRKKKKNRSKKKGASKPRVNGINGGMSDEQPESVQCTSAVEEDIMESPGRFGDEERVAKQIGPLPKSLMSLLQDDDKLDLAGLLNVLDGIVETPGRLVIMTSNYPERLDSALLRPGRIDKKIYLSYIKLAEAVEMIEHYFACAQDQEKSSDTSPECEGKECRAEIISKKQKQRLLEIIKTMEPAGFTPAELQQYCAECATVSDLLDTLTSHTISGEEVH